MKSVFLRVSAVLAWISITFARPQQPVENVLPMSHSTGSDMGDPLLIEGDPVNAVNTKSVVSLLDASKWKRMLADGKVQEMVDTIQRALGARRAVRARTQWGGVEHPELGNAVRNTVSWNAYKSDKNSLNIIMDSKFNKDKGKVNVFDPSLGLSFQMKY